MPNSNRVSGAVGNICRVVGTVIHFNSIKDLVIINGEYVHLMSYVGKINTRTILDLRKMNVENPN